MNNDSKMKYSGDPESLHRVGQNNAPKVQGEFVNNHPAPLMAEDGLIKGTNQSATAKLRNNMMGN
jgi:hypothetical protein